MTRITFLSPSRILVVLAMCLATPQAARASGSLWLCNNGGGTILHTDTSGTIIESVAEGCTGVAFDGTYLYVSNFDGTITRRTVDGATILASAVVTGSPEDLS